MPTLMPQRAEDGACVSATTSAASSPLLLGASASSIDTDRTFVVANRSLTRPPSPAPLLCVTLMLPPSMTMARPSQRSDTAGRVCSPAKRRGSCAAVDSASDMGTPLFSARRGAAAVEDCVRTSLPATPSLRVSFSAVDLVDDAAEDTEEADFLCAAPSSVAVTRACETSTASSADWATLWMQIFPLHIASFLCVQDVVEVGQVCRLAREAARQPWVWRTLATHHHGIQPAAVEGTFATAARQWLQEAAPPSPVVPTRTVDEEEPLSPLPATTRLSRCTPAPVLATSPHHRRTSQRRCLVVPPVTGLERAREEDAAAHTGEDAEMAAAQQRSSPRFSTTTTTTAAPAVTAQSAHGPLSPGVNAGRPAASAAASAPATSASATSSSSPLRYLWQTTAAAMPSPSSPAAYQDEEEDGSHSDTGNLPREEPTTFATAAPLGVTTPTAVSASRLMDQPIYCASPRSGAMTPLAEEPGHGFPTMSVATTAPGKWRALRWATAQESLPPPTPGQLETSATSGDAVAAGDGDPALWASFSASSIRPHPSYTFDPVTDGTADTASSPAPLTAHGAGPPPAAAASAPPALTAYNYTLCRATAERTLLRAPPVFPWRAFTQYLHLNRVQRSLTQLVALSNRARAELFRGGAWDAAYGSLSHAVHVLMQPGSCRSVEHLTYLAETLVRRASLCQHRGHYFALAAFMDLSLAAMLCPESTSMADLAELRTRPELVHETPASWLQRCGEAAAVASPVALLSSTAQVPALFPQHRALCFCSALTSYMQVRRRLGHSLSHLLCRAAECAAVGSEEVLLVSALREVAAAAAQHGSEAALSARRACATADYALSLLPLSVRDATETLCAAWVRDCLPAGRLASPDVIAGWADTAPEASAYHQGTPLEVRWLAWLAHEVRSYAHEELACTAPAQAPLLSVVFAFTADTRAEALVRLAAQYANPETRSEDLQPALPYGTGRDALAKALLAGALHLRRLHTSAAILLARLHGRDAETADWASTVLTDCIHAWAQRCSLLEMLAAADTKRNRLKATTTTTNTTTTAPTRSPLQQQQQLRTPVARYLHRRDRKPELCYVPAELLVERSRCVRTIADLAEATEQHPSLSYPYQMRAAMAMDRGYHLAAVMELSRIMTLTMDVNDVALRVRFLHDATDMAATAANAAAAAAAAAVAASASSASLSASVPVLAAADAVLTSMPIDTALAVELSTPRVGTPASAAAASAPGGVGSSTPGAMSGGMMAPADGTSLTSHQLALLYQAWLARMSGLLSLLSPPLTEPPHNAAAASAASSTNASAPRSQLASRDGLLMTGGGAGAGQGPVNGHVSRVASFAFSDADEEEVRSGTIGSVGFDAAHIRAFLDDLLVPTSSAPVAATAITVPGL